MKYVKYLKLKANEEEPEIQGLQTDWILFRTLYFDGNQFRDHFWVHKATVASLTELLKGIWQLKEIVVETHAIIPNLQVLIILLSYAYRTVYRMMLNYSMRVGYQYS